MNDTEKLQKVYLAGGHVCGNCKNGTHATCFGTCQCAYCDIYWTKLSDEAQDRHNVEKLGGGD